jgi:hypothetical protein
MSIVAGRLSFFFSIYFTSLFATPYNSVTFVSFSVCVTPEFPWWPNVVNYNNAKNALFYLKFQSLI